MTTKKWLRDRTSNMESAAKTFLEVDRRVQRGELRPWGRAYKNAIKDLREALEENYGAPS